MALLLDPALSIVWRSPTCLQIGVDRPVVTLNEVTLAEERMIAALAKGISRSGLTMIGRSAGVDDTQITALLQRLGPALAPGPEASSRDVRPSTPATADTAGPRLVALDGSGPTATRLATLLTGHGFTAVHCDAAASPPGTLAAVVIGHFVLAPHRAGGWLRRDIRHLPIIFGDTQVQIGPFVHPGRGPCLHCVQLHRRDRDPAWTAMASQLLGRRAPAETVTVAWETATRAVRLMDAAFQPDRSSQPEHPAHLAHTSRHLDVATGRVTSLWQQPHPDCGCRVLPGTETAIVTPRDARPSATTTAEELVAPA